ncbi:hypothetical protein [Microbispora sp. H10836]|uniref:hypothetical protein n=1 Tax=Microbispora sp. H10836 TaxID=2729106 RepID=UPI001B8B4C60|nr:hypothetical protein [Microbispora sp. H10836]
MPKRAPRLQSHGFAPGGAGDGLVLTEDRALAHPEEIATLLVHAGCPPTRLLIEEEDLETYFLRMVGAGDA